MSLFSQRKGITPLTKALQREAIDEELKNRLWSAIQITIWDYWSHPRERRSQDEEDAHKVETLIEGCWLSYLKFPLDKLPKFNLGGFEYACQVMRDHFYKEPWWQTYDLLEVLIKYAPDEWSNNLKEWSNNYLQEENAAYRIVGDEIVEITDEYEVEAVETALDKGIKASREHLHRALELLSDRPQPDYRNSIKESISAVEAVCQVVAGKPKATLSDCLKAITSSCSLHSAFEKSLSLLYGYTSDEGGIRHALKENSISPSYADAKFMLVSCAAINNFLLTKAAESKIVIPVS